MLVYGGIVPSRLHHQTTRECLDRLHLLADLRARYPQVKLFAFSLIMRAPCYNSADEAMMDALDAGAEDFDASEDAAEVTTDPENYSAVVKALEEKGYEILSDDLAMVPMTTTRLTDPDQLKQMGKLLDSLEDNDDVQNVWHSLENEEDLPE
jgi:transcriptional/translational regulatory protein YebC/TACO1